MRRSPDRRRNYRRRVVNRRHWIEADDPFDDEREVEIGGGPPPLLDEDKSA